jgi:hypothetical protein
MTYAKSLILAFVSALLLMSPLTAVFAGGNSESYTVEYGDTLWGIADEHLGNPWCWSLIASIPENNLDYQGLLFVGDVITMPSIENCNAITNPLQTNYSVSESTVTYLPTQPWHEQNFLLHDYLERNYRDAVRLRSYFNYDNMFHNYSGDLYRERDGDTWYVVEDGVRGQAWDYVDHLIMNDETDSVFYRARDVRGEWYVVKNKVATKLSFEPKRIHLNPVADDVIAFTPDDTQTQMYSPTEAWTIPVSALPVAISPDGHILFRETKYVRVETLIDGGSKKDFCSSSVCSHDYSYWLDGEQVASSTNRMVPLFSESDAVVKLPFFYEGTQKAFKYFGVFARPWFDDNGDLVFMTVKDNLVTKQVIDIR